MRLLVKVKTNSKIESITKEGNVFIVRVSEPPREGKANQAVIKLLSQQFGISKSKIRIINGFRSRNKLVEILAED
jgi:uncharacterized protein (TIGR00251 family)